MEAVAGIAVISFVMVKVIDIVRKLLPGLDGNLITLVALVIGGGISFGAAALGSPLAPILAVDPPWVEHVVNAGFLAFGAGFVADITSPFRAATSVGVHEVGAILDN